MRIKRKNGLKIAAITIALLLCLALAVGITGAWYQAKRQATGTLSMDQGIIIDYKGFGQTPDEGIWTRDTTTTFLLFNETNAQPGEQIAVNPAGIRANEKSVNFYARVKLSYKFYNGETPVELADATKLIKTSSSFWANSWVDGGSSDGYYYYATGSTLNKFAKTATTFVELFATDAKFIIEGAGFTGANNNGESGGFKIDETTSINKIEVYLTLETLQGDVQTEELKTMGWKIAQTVDFSKVDEGKIVTSAKGELVDEKLNVTINGNQTKLEEVKFPYGEETVLEFDSKNVEYVELKYSDNTTEKFYELEASENSATKNSQIQVLADESHGTVKGYIVGWFSDSEYTGFAFSNTVTMSGYGDDLITETLPNGQIAIAGYFGSATNLTNLPTSLKVKTRSFKLKIEPYTSWMEFIDLFATKESMIQYPCYVNGTKYDDRDALDAWAYGLEEDADFMTKYPTITITFDAICEATGIGGDKKTVTAINGMAFYMNKTLTSVEIPEGITKIGGSAFEECSFLTTIRISSTVTELAAYCFHVKPGDSAGPEYVIDSAAVANLTESESSLVWYASKLYIKSDLTVGAYITGSCTKGTSDKAGYDMYTKNA